MEYKGHTEILRKNFLLPITFFSSILSNTHAMSGRRVNRGRENGTSVRSCARGSTKDDGIVSPAKSNESIGFTRRKSNWIHLHAYCVRERISSSGFDYLDVLQWRRHQPKFIRWMLLRTECYYELGNWIGLYVCGESNDESYFFQQKKDV